MGLSQRHAAGASKTGGGSDSRSGSPSKGSDSAAPRGSAALPAGDFLPDGEKPAHILFGNAPVGGTESDIAPYEKFIPWLLLALALCTRFYRLTVPWGVVRLPPPPPPCL